MLSYLKLVPSGCVSVQPVVLLPTSVFCPGAVRNTRAAVEVGVQEVRRVDGERVRSDPGVRLGKAMVGTRPAHAELG